MALIFLLLLLLPVAELAVIVAASGAIGLVPTLAALLTCSVLGAWLVRREGWSVWRRAGDELSAGRLPAREMLDGVVLVCAGALLLVPGFITDAIGLVLLLPPTRAVVRRWMMRHVEVGGGVPTVLGGPLGPMGARWSHAGRSQAGWPQAGWRGPTVEATGHEADPSRPASARVVRVEVDRPDAVGPGR